MLAMRVLQTPPCLLGLWQFLATPAARSTAMKAPLMARWVTNHHIPFHRRMLKPASHDTVLRAMLKSREDAKIGECGRGAEVPLMLSRWI